MIIRVLTPHELQEFLSEIDRFIHLTIFRMCHRDWAIRIVQHNRIVRNIRIDSPTPSAIEPSYSSGHWQGNVLVVETTALKKIQARGVPWASVQRVVERIRKAENGRPERIMRFEATTADDKPITMTTRSVYRLDPTQHLYEFICEDAADRFEAAKK